MKKNLKALWRSWLIFLVLVSGGVVGQHLKLEAQLELPTPVIVNPDPIRGPEEEAILALEVRDGLKQFLLADLYIQHGQYEDAQTILVQQARKEADPELKQLLAYLEQKLAVIQESGPEEGSLQEVIRQAEAGYDKAEFYFKHGKHDKAVPLLLDALQLYQNAGHEEGQILVRHQLALAYKELDRKEEALHHAREFLELYHNLKIVKKFEQLQSLVAELEEDAIQP